MQKHLPRGAQHLHANVIAFHVSLPCFPSCEGHRITSLVPRLLRSSPHPFQPRFRLSAGISLLPLPATYPSSSIVLYITALSLYLSLSLSLSLCIRVGFCDSFLLAGTSSLFSYFSLLCFLRPPLDTRVRGYETRKDGKNRAENDHSRPCIKHGHNCNATFRIFVLLYMPFSDVSTGFGVRRDPFTVYEGNRLHLFSRYAK